MWRFDKGGLVIYIQDGGFIHRKRIEKKIDAFELRENRSSGPKYILMTKGKEKKKKH